jgi:hypothetical protein
VKISACSTSSAGAFLNLFVLANETPDESMTIPKAQTGSEVCTRDGGGYEKSHQTPSTSITTGVKVGIVLDSDTFQIPGPDGSLILNIFKYSEPTVLMILQLFKYPDPAVLLF